MNRLISLFFIAIIYITNALCALEENSSYKSNILIVTYDAGETFALLPVIHELEKRKASYLILAMGTSTNILNKSDVAKNKIINLNSNLSYPQAINSTWDRFNEPELDELSKALDKVQASVVISGVASFMQRHILHYFSKKGAYTFSYYDNFNPVQKSFYYPIAKEIHNLVDNVLVPSPVVQGSIYRSNVNIVGHPTVEQWSKYPFIFSKSRTRKNWNLPAGPSIITFIGGYEDGFQEACKSFLEEIKRNPSYFVLLSLHPKSDGKWEEALISEMELDNVLILNKSQTTPEAVIASDLVVCHKSTVGIQALFAERPVLFYDPTVDQIPYNVAVNSWDLASMCVSQDNLIKSIESSLKRKLIPDTLYRKTGIPRDSTMMITHLLMQYRAHPK